MNIEKLTDRTQGMIQNAQNLAVRSSHPYVTPVHLLAVLLEDKKGLASTLLTQAGVDVSALDKRVAEELQKIPQVSGSAVQVSFSQDFLKTIDKAEQMAAKAKDAYVTVERVLQALLLDSKWGVDAQKLNAVINEMRQGRTAESPSPRVSPSPSQ